MRLLTRLLVAALPVAALLGCSGSGSTPGPTTINSEVKEYSISLDRTTVPPGEVAFKVKNSGTVVHEFVVIDTDTAADQLPQANGEVSEDALTVVDEIEDIAVGATPELKVKLTAGHYAVICNIPGHYPGGMHVDLTVQ